MLFTHWLLRDIDLSATGTAAIDLTNPATGTYALPQRNIGAKNILWFSNV